MRRQQTIRWNFARTVQPFFFGGSTVVIILLFALDIGGLAPPTFAHDEGRHSILKSSADQDSIGSKANDAGATDIPVAKEGRSGQGKADKKPRRLIKKATKPIVNNPVDASPQDPGSSIAEETEPDSETGEKKKSRVTMGNVPAGSAPTGNEMVPQGSLSTVAPATMSPPPAAAAMAETSALTGIGAGTAPNAGGRGMQQLIQQVPGLSQMLIGAGPVIPQEPIAPLPPPLLPPPSGVPAAPVNWFAYHVLNRLTYGGTPN